MNEILTINPTELLKTDPHLAEKAFARLDFAQQQRVVLDAPYAQREALCDLAEDSKALIQSLPPEELWLTIRADDPQQSLALFQRMSPEQVQFCFDVESWQKDRWQPEATLEWLRIVAASGREKIAEYFAKGDQELVGLLCKQWVTIYVREGDEDIGDAIDWPREEAPVTVDGVYYFMINDERVDQWLRPMMLSYGQGNADELRSLLSNLRAMTLADQEEHAYEWRERRMAEHGFVPFDEAIAVYHRFNDTTFANAVKRQHMPDALESQAGFPLIMLEQRGVESTFVTALRSVEDRALLDSCVLEIARLANRIVIADGENIAPDTLQRALAKAVGYINIGLEYLSEKEIVAPGQLLREYWLQSLLQRGFSLVLDQADTLRKWRSERPTLEVSDDPSELDHMAFERIKAAMQKWPQFYVGPQSDDGELLREFRSLEDLAAVRASMLVLE